MATTPFPTAAIPLIGRDAELTEIERLLSQPTCRLLTLVGPGGIGKTCLAQEAMQRAASQAVHFAACQSLASPDFMVSTIADSIDFHFYSGSSPKQQLLNYLSDQSMLLVLDNLEHLLDGVMLLSEILNAAPHIRILATSRERLNLREEWVLQVGGLNLPAAGTTTDLQAYSAIELFIQHAQRANVSFRLTQDDEAAVIRICRLVGGMPLAIELAALWVRALSCEQIADEIALSLDILETATRNVEPRHRTMRAAFEPTWERLSETERTVFKCLSVFRGGFTREAAEYVAGASLRTLTALVDKSLLRLVDNRRYDLHDLMRQYGAEQLGQSPEQMAETRDRHCTYYADFMKIQWSRLTGSEIKSALTAIQIELNNVRSAWGWAVSRRKAAEIEAVLPSLWFFYGVSSQQHEGSRVFGSAASSFQDHPAVRAKLMARWGELEIIAGAFSKATALLNDSLKLLRQVDARSEIAFVLYRLVYFRVVLGPDAVEQNNVIDYLEESLALYTELDDHFNIGEVLLTWGTHYLGMYDDHRHPDDLERARQGFQKSLVAFQKRDSLFGIANAHWGLCTVSARYEDYHDALQHIQVSRKIHWELDIDWALPQTLALEGLMACRLDDYELARWCALENLRFNLESGLERAAYETDFITTIILTSLHQAAAVLMADGKHTRAYEALAKVRQQFLDFQTQPEQTTFFLLHLLDEPVLPPLTEAVNLGHARDLESLIKDVIADLSAVKPAAPEGKAQLTDNILNEREKEIVKLTIDGLNSREIAQQLYLSVTTVRWYLRQIYSKLDVHSRSELIACVRKMNLLT